MRPFRKVWETACANLSVTVRAGSFMQTEPGSRPSHEIGAGGVGRVLFCAVLASAWMGSARAEEAADGSAPLVLNVRPSRFEDGARERQERLLRRARDAEFALRWICTGCGTTRAYSPDVGTAFSPHGALAPRPQRQVRSEPPPAPEQTENSAIRD